MMPVTHSQFQTRRAGLDSLAPLSNRLGAYEKELRPDPPNRSGNITESRSIYQFGTSSATHLRFKCGGFQFGQTGNAASASSRRASALRAMQKSRLRPFSGEQRRKSRSHQHHHRPPPEDHGHAGPLLQLGYAGVPQPSQDNRPDCEHIERSRYGIEEVGTGVNQSSQVAGNRVLEGEGFTPSHAYR